MFRNLLLTAILLVFAGVALMAQTPRFGYFKQPRVVVGADSLLNPFAGGINNAQPSFIHFNGDTLRDLAIFDRASSRFVTYVAVKNNGTIKYLHKPEYEFVFPKLGQWALLRDYDGDGLADIFTYGVLGLDIWKNIGNPFSPSFRRIKKDVRTERFFQSPINLAINPGDVPAIVDIDGDGDLDIFSVAFGAGSVEFNQNLSVERYGHNDSLVFRKDSTAWGKFRVPFMCYDWVFTGSRIAHLGSTINLRDLDADGDLDVLMGDVSCSPLYRIENLRTTANPLFRGVDSLWPSASIAAMSYRFPASYNLDIDQDGQDELIVSSNYQEFENYPEDLENSMWLYRQNGANWSRLSKNWLQNTQIDVGSQAYPALADIDADGDLDLIIGTKCRVLSGMSPRATLSLYRNTGSAQNPIFTFENGDYLNFSAANVRFLKPVFADINGDGAQDLLVTSSSGGFTGQWLVLYNQNTSGAFQFNGSPIPYSPSGVLQLPDDAVAPVDIDNDNDLDFFVGRDGGYLNLIVNNGSNAAPNYQGRTINFGLTFRNDYFATNPCVADFNKDGQLDIITGNSSGNIRFYNNGVSWQLSQAALVPDSSIIIEPVSGIAQDFSFGVFTAPTAADLNGDGWPDLVIGLKSGGIRVLYNSTLSSNGVADGVNNKKLSLSSYPNPTTGKFRVGGLAESSANGLMLQVFNNQGKRVWKGQPTREGEIDITTLPIGLYLLEALNAQGQRWATKIVKE